MNLARQLPVLLLAGVGGLLPTAARAAEGGVVADLFYPLLNLGLLFVVLYFTARKPVLGFFRERRDRIESELENAAQLKAEAEAQYARWQRQLVELDSELEQIRATARERAASERERILADAQTAAERIRTDAHVAIDQELRRARKLLREEASSLSIELAGELLRGQVGDADRDRLVDEFIEKIEGPTGDEAGR